MSELLAPAGTLEKLKWAVAYGADAVYFGTKEGSLRSYAGNFSLEEAEEGLNHLHENGRKGYITLNIYPYSEEYTSLLDTAKSLNDMKADAFIVSDLGLIFELKKLGLSVPIHISTQANTLSHQTIEAYRQLGAKRVNLARELSLERIKEIQKEANKTGIETEVFIHGAVCFSYSGRCAISDYLTGRGANRGECAQACRWNYHLVEEKRPGEYLPVFEDERGLYFFNSKDLALFPFIDELQKAGVISFKIEGRMKTVHYLASVISFYRRVMDGEKISPEEGFRYLSRITNRGYSYGFMKGENTYEDYSFETSDSAATSTFVGDIAERGPVYSVLRVRNKITAGDRLEVLHTNGTISEFIMPEKLITTENEELEVANSHQHLKINADFDLFTVFRKVKE
ncbi:MAG: U32 family peptidase [Acidobacteria bacterium]|nr:U32 family peptidase [Acidobacteriota bacterium]